MKILMVGSGGREHALVWKMAQSDAVTQVLVAPGNGGTAVEAKVRNVPIAANEVESLLNLATEESIDLTVIGPEAPLAAGIVDRFQQNSLKCFGPTAAAAELESSKAFAKDFLTRHRIPTAVWTVVETVEAGLGFIDSHHFPLVLKADGLAAGKGVVIVHDRAGAEHTLRDMLSGQAFGQAGSRVVIEEFLEGEEASFIALVDGETVVPLATSQDHKQRDDGDRGPNTGGMGACSPAPVVTPELEHRILEQIMQATATGMLADGRHFTGFLYAGLMMTTVGPKVLEFNVRMGDPETQPVMMRLKSNLARVLLDTVEGRLDQVVLDWDQRAALGVVMAAGGYPDRYDKGNRIDGLERELPDHIKVFHAGTDYSDGQWTTTGGRVLCVTALGDNIHTAQTEAYRHVPDIEFQNAYFRKDIGHRALKHETN